ncbi:MAG: hypothetical protein J0H19_24085 [Rhodospirillales bacterium]|nr:hypothetical protein [Rhodospirillales bacterium]MBN8929688.1 hypothetical protein [Rhodospirillales bacterium]
MLANAYLAHIERQPDSVRKNLHLNDVMTRAYHALGGQEGLEPQLPAQPDIQTGGAYGPSLAYTIRTGDKPKP